MSLTLPINGVIAPPPTMAITMHAPPVLVRGPRPFTPRAKMVGYIIDIKKLFAIRQPTPIHPGFSTATVQAAALMTAKMARSRDACTYSSSQVEVNLPAVNASNVPVRIYPAAALFGFCVGEHIGDLVAPNGHLRAYIKKLRDHCEDKMLPFEEGRPVISRCLRGRVIHTHVRKGRASNEHAPEKHDCAKDHIGNNHPQGLRAQVILVGASGLHRGNLHLGELHAGEDETGPDEQSHDAAHGIEGLGEIQSLLGAVGRPNLHNERARAGFKERQSAGDDEQRSQEKRVLADHGRRPKQNAADAVETQPDEDARLVPRAPHDAPRRESQRK